MLEDYVVEVYTPIETESAEHFSFGWQFGYHQDEGGGEEEEIQYWDGQDIWLDQDHNRLFAMFKGTLHFVSSWHPIHPSTEGDEDEAEGETSIEEYPAIGDTLVLKIWPQDFIKLGELLPEGSLIPKEVVYQNVNIESVRQRARELIRETPGYGEDEVTDADVDELLQRWVEGEGSGIYVPVGSYIGNAVRVDNIPPRPDEVSDVEVEHSVPEGVDAGEWARLTLKVIDDKNLYYSPCYLFYLISNTGDEDWITRPRIEDENPFVASCSTIVDSLHVIKLTSQLREDWDYGDPPDESMPDALPGVRLRIKREVEDRFTPALFDPFYPEPGHWRVQGLVYPGNYEWNFEAPPLYAQLNHPAFISFYPNPPPPSQGLHLQLLHWLEIDGLRRFIFGVNMEAFRRKNNHDLSGNDIFNYSNPELDAWDYPGGPWTEKMKNLDDDLQNIALSGATAIRVWVFEMFEGLRFSFTEPSSAPAGSSANTLLQHIQEELSIDGIIRYTTSFERNGAGIYACTKSTFDNHIKPQLDRTNWLAPETNELMTRLILNAQFLQKRAAVHGLRVLWTLWVHYGTDAIGNARWQNFITNTAANGGDGLLPVDAWIYRMTMVDSDCRRSYIDRALRRFVSQMESAPGAALGYEIMNEADNVWEGCEDDDKLRISGQRIGKPTHWLLSRDELRSFIIECSEAIRDELVGAGHPNRLILSGVLGSKSRITQNELSLLTPEGNPPRPRLSASALTRYASANEWNDLDGRTRNPTLVVAPPADDPSRNAWLRAHGNACLFIEAGQPNRDYDCIAQFTTVYWLLIAAFYAGYAGVFLWHYNDPARPNNEGRNANALVEANPPEGVHAPESTKMDQEIPLKGGAHARPVYSVLLDLQNRLLGPYQLPYIPEGDRPIDDRPDIP